MFNIFLVTLPINSSIQSSNETLSKDVHPTRIPKHNNKHIIFLLKAI